MDDDAIPQPDGGYATPRDAGARRVEDPDSRSAATQQAPTGDDTIG